MHIINKTDDVSINEKNELYQFILINNLKGRITNRTLMKKLDYLKISQLAKNGLVIEQFHKYLN